MSTGMVKQSQGYPGSLSPSTLERDVPIMVGDAHALCLVRDVQRSRLAVAIDVVTSRLKQRQPGSGFPQNLTPEILQ